MELLANDVEKMLGLRLNAEQEQAFQRYASEILEWNQRSSLTAIRSEEGVRVRHFLDSLSCWLAMSEGGDKVIDIGAGAGLPGLALKILHNPMQLTLVESVGKKTDFLNHSVQVLGLDQVRVLQGRAEELGQQPGERESYDWAIARAVAPLPVLVEYLLPFVRVGGKMLAQKGKRTLEEVKKARQAVRLLGGGDIDLQQVQVPELEGERYLVVVEKLRETPHKYPRHVGVPGKQPL